jgi:type II secretory pathway pseudopilin PulG
MYCAWCGTPVAAVSYTPCPRCGNPTNGAQRQVAAQSGGSNAAITVVIVAVGALFVIAIVGILAAIAIPNLLTAMQRSKQKRTMADMRSVSTAVEAYATDTNQYPKVASYDDLQPLLVPKYIRSLPTRDGWNNPLRYACVKEEQGRCTGYAVGSAGKDGRFERDDLTAYVQSPPGGTRSFDCDLVYSNGEFIEYPEGVQH